MDASAADVQPRLEGLIDATRAFSADAALGLTARLAAGIPEWHTGFVQHPRLELLHQRIYQIACG